MTETAGMTATVAGIRASVANVAAASVDTTKVIETIATMTVTTVGDASLHEVDANRPIRAIETMIVTTVIVHPVVNVTMLGISITAKTTLLEVDGSVPEV